MRKVISIILLLAFIITIGGCKQTSEPFMSKPPLIEDGVMPDSSESSIVDLPNIAEKVVDNPGLLNIYFARMSRSSMMDPLSIAAFEKYIKEQFDLDIKIRYIDISQEGWEKSFEETDNDGIVYYEELSAFYLLSQNNLCLPLNQFIPENYCNHETWTTGRDLLINSKGVIEGIPAYYRESFVYRTYVKNALESENLTIPTTVYEFDKFSRDLADKGYYTAAVNSGGDSFFSEFIDLFVAYGVHFNPNDLGGISYNPLTQKYELPLLNDNFIEVMEYIVTLLDDNRIIVYNSSSQLIDKKLVTYINEPFRYFEGKQVLYDYSTHFYNENDNNSLPDNGNSLITVKSGVRGYSILPASYNVEGKLSFLLEQLFVNTDLALAFTYGIEGQQFNIIDGEVVLERYDFAKDYWSRPGFYSNYYDSPFVVRYGDTTIPNSNSVISNYVAKVRNARELYNPSMFFDVNRYVKADIQAAYKDVTSYALIKFFTYLNEDDKAVAEAIDLYRADMEEKGVIQFIDQLNGN